MLPLPTGHPIRTIGSVARGHPCHVTLALVRLQLSDTKFVNSHDYGVGYWWIHGLQYSAVGYGNDRDVIMGLLADPWYHHDYHGFPVNAPDPRTQALHGPYRLDAITVDNFVKRSRTDALESLDRWLEENGSTAETTRDFRTAIDLLLPTDFNLYELPDLGPTSQHEYGSTLGADSGFVEFVAVAPDFTAVTVLVATDD
jgi:hypothetical protein